MSSFQFKTVLVIGGSGFLGSHIVKRLQSEYHASKIVIASRQQPTVVPEGVEWNSVDVSSPDSITSLFEKVQPQVVIHTAGPNYLAKAKEQEAITINGTSLLLQAAKGCKATKAFVYTSTDSACHSSPTIQITEEEARLNTSKYYSYPYGRAKALADTAVLAANSLDLRTATIRVPAIYGEEDYNFSKQLVEAIKKNEHKTQVGPDTKLFEFVYAASAAEGHILAAKALLTGTPGADGQAYFITDNKPQPFFTFCRKCYAAAGSTVKESEISTVPFWLVRTIASVGEWVVWAVTFGTGTPGLRRQEIDHLDGGCWWNIEKAERLLGYKPVLDQDEAIEKSMKWAVEKFS